MYMSLRSKIISRDGKFRIFEIISHPAITDSYKIKLLTPLLKKVQNLFLKLPLGNEQFRNFFVDASIGRTTTPRQCALPKEKKKVIQSARKFKAS